MPALARRQIRETGVSIPPLCFGTSRLGNTLENESDEAGIARAISTVKTILTSDSPFIDVSRNYCMGRSEERIGLALQDLGGLPENAIVSTKLDRDSQTRSFNASNARRSIEESLEALKLDKIDILHLHDPEHASDLEPITRKGGAVDELFKMREEGLCRAVGLAAGNVDIMLPILKQFDFDIIVTHNRHTLINGNAEEMLEFTTENNIAVMNAAPYCGGVLAKGSDNLKRYVYQDADDDTLAPVRLVEAVCRKHKVPPGAVALQFSTRDARIHSTICGVNQSERVQQTLEWAMHSVNDEVWEELSVLPRSNEDPEHSRDFSHT